MRDLIADLKRWRAAGKHHLALATIVATQGSSLRPAGTRMAITAEGDIAGSISSGCVDSDIIAAMEVFLETENIPFKHLHFGAAPARRLDHETPLSSRGEQEEAPPAPDEVGRAGLACGGELDVIIERWCPIYDQLMAEIEAERPVGFVMTIHADAKPGERLCHWLYTVGANGTTTEVVTTNGATAVLADAMSEIREAWPGPDTATKVLATDGKSVGQGFVFVEVLPPPPVLLIFGATDIAISLTQMAQHLDYHVIVSDARRAFLTERRFPDAELRLGWPHDLFAPEGIGPNWAVVVLFHDPKLDGPALELALRSQALYVGLLGSRRTQAERRAMLRGMGFGDADLARIHGPVGLNIGGRHPAMIALSILSEVVAVRNKAALVADTDAPVARPYEPDPVPAEDFHGTGKWATINLAPYDIDAPHLNAAGVVYKRAAHSQRVRYTPLIPALEMPEPWRGRGEAIVRWLFSECSSVAPQAQNRLREGLLEDRAFAFVHDTTIMPGASSGMEAHLDMDEILYVVAGEGMLYHRLTDGSPVIARPLRPGDAVLVRGGIYHSIANKAERVGSPANTNWPGGEGRPLEEPLRLIVIGLKNA